jgi:hypothetical protein
MMNFQGPRKIFLAVAAAAFLTVAGCSNKATDEAANQPAPQVPAKKAAAKPAAPKTAAAKPAAKKSDSGKVVAAKGTAAKPSAKPATASSKVMPTTTLVTVPKGTTISATVGQALASSKNHSGDTFAAVLSSSIKVDGKTIIPKGTHVTGRVVSAKKSTAELTVALSSVDLNGKSYKLVSDPITRSAKAPAKTDASDTDAAKAAPKNVTVAAQTRLKFKLAKDVKLPAAVKS